MNAIEGNDGKLYFNYGIGAEFKLYQNGKELCVITITDCFLDERDQTEKYFIESHKNFGHLLPYPIKRLEKLLQFGQAEEIRCGVAREYPLLKEEVELYYTDQREEQIRAKVAAVKYMEKTTGYNALVKQQTEIERLLARAIAEESDSAAEILAQYEAIRESRRALIISKGIDIKLFEPESYCPGCGGKGITPQGNICYCAREQEEKIKKWNAARRIKRHLGDSWAVGKKTVEYGEGLSPDRQIDNSAKAISGNE